MSFDDIRKELGERIPGVCIEENVPMAQYTSFRAGGKARMMVIPADAEQLSAVLGVLSGSGVQYMVLGNGTNILVKDSGYDGVIVKIGSGFDYVRQEGCRLVCGSGTRMSVAAKAALEGGLSGFEFASGIPGFTGGAVFMNAGAYGGEMKDILRRAKIVSKDGSREFYMTADELEMGYRHTKLHDTGDIVTEVEFVLEEGNRTQIKAKMSELMEFQAACELPERWQLFQKTGRIFCRKADTGRRSQRAFCGWSSGLGASQRLYNKQGRSDSD